MLFVEALRADARQSKEGTTETEQGEHSRDRARRKYDRDTARRKYDRDRATQRFLLG